MDLLHALRTTGSTRSFLPDPVDDATLYRILDSARFAPSGGNTQLWHVTVVKDRSLREQLGDLASEVWTQYVAISEAGTRPFAVREDGKFHGHPIDLDALKGTRAPNPLVDNLADAPAVLVISARITAMAMMDIELERKSFVGGASIYPFFHNILLAARAEGLGSVLTTFLARKEPEVQRLLHLPKEQAVAGMIALGRPERELTKLRRNPVESFTTINTYTGPPLKPT